MLGLMNLMEKQVNKSDFYSSFDATMLVASFLFSGMGGVYFFGVFEDRVWGVFVGCLVLSKNVIFFNLEVLIARFYFSSRPKKV